MKVVHIGTHEQEGGAARAMYRLHTGLLRQGVESVIFCMHARSNSSSVVQFTPTRTLSLRVKRSWRHRQLSKQKEVIAGREPNAGTFSPDRTPYREDLMNQLPDADLYHLHWVSGFLDLPSFFEKLDKPVVWTLHDMNPFTGGCHYDNGCGRFAGTCGACPQLEAEQESDLSREVYSRKQKAISAFPNESLRVAADSHWLAEEAARSGIFGGKEIETIHYGLDHELFAPGCKHSARKELELASGTPVVLFGAHQVSHARKGLDILRKALSILDPSISGMCLVTFGDGDIEPLPGMEQRHLGPVWDDRKLARVYHAADLFVIPSRQEAFGQTCMEAMACGIPCAGFRTGGIPDMIEEGVTGSLAEPGSPEALAEAISRTLKEKEQLGKNARSMVEQAFTLKHQADSYLRAYQGLLQHSN